MNRRAFLRVLGLVPIVGPAVVKAIAAPAAAEEARTWYLAARTNPIFNGSLGQWGGVTFVEVDKLPVLHGEALPGCEMPDVYDPPESVEIIDEMLEAPDRPLFLVVSPTMYESLRTEPGFVDVDRP